MKTSLLPMLLGVGVILTVIPGTAEAGGRSRHHGPPPAHVIVTNQSGTDVTVSLSGAPSRTLAAWQTADFHTPAGEISLRATYIQFGSERLLESERLSLYPERTARIVLEPEDSARTFVTNDSPYEAVLFVDGRPGPSFAPGASRIVSTHLGRTDLQLVAGQRTLGRTSMDMRAYAETRWVVSPPRVGDLVVQNPLPVPIELVCSKGLVRTVPAFGQAVYDDIVAGSFQLTARRVTDEFIDSQVSEIRGGATTTWRVDPPRTGFVDLDSDHFMAAEVRFDGRRVAMVAPDNNYRVEAAVGWHEVDIRDEYGRTLHHSWVEVEPFTNERVSFGTPAHERADQRHDRDERNDREDSHERHDHRDSHDTVAQAESCSMH